MDQQTENYTIYNTFTDTVHPSTPSDARRDGANFWWLDSLNSLIGRASVVGGAYTYWEVPDAYWLYGTAIDATGALWASDVSQPYVYKLSVNQAGTTGVLCTYPIPSEGITTYLAYQDPYLWLGDEINFRLLRVNLNDNTYFGGNCR